MFLAKFLFGAFLFFIAVLFLSLVATDVLPTGGISTPLAYILLSFALLFGMNFLWEGYWEQG